MTSPSPKARKTFGSSPIPTTSRKVHDDWPNPIKNTAMVTTVSDDKYPIVDEDLIDVADIVAEAEAISTLTSERHDQDVITEGAETSHLDAVVATFNEAIEDPSMTGDALIPPFTLKSNCVMLPCLLNTGWRMRLFDGNDKFAVRGLRVGKKNSLFVKLTPLCVPVRLQREGFVTAEVPRETFGEKFGGYTFDELFHLVMGMSLEEAIDTVSGDITNIAPSDAKPSEPEGWGDW